jgi:hypothetical protein
MKKAKSGWWGDFYISILTPLPPRQEAIRLHMIVLMIVSSRAEEYVSITPLFLLSQFWWVWMRCAHTFFTRFSVQMKRQKKIEVDGGTLWDLKQQRSSGHEISQVWFRRVTAWGEKGGLYQDPHSVHPRGTQVTHEKPKPVAACCTRIANTWSTTIPSLLFCYGSYVELRNAVRTHVLYTLLCE